MTVDQIICDQSWQVEVEVEFSQRFQYAYNLEYVSEEMCLGFELIPMTTDQFTSTNVYLLHDREKSNAHYFSVWLESRFGIFAILSVCLSCTICTK